MKRESEPRRTEVRRSGSGQAADRAGAVSDLRALDAHTVEHRDEQAPSTGGNSYARARAAREAILARLAKLDLDKAIGKVVDADLIRTKWFDLGRKTRESVMTVPDRVAPLVTGLMDVNEVHRIMMDELRVALETLAAGE